MAVEFAKENEDEFIQIVNDKLSIDPDIAKTASDGNILEESFHQKHLDVLNSINEWAKNAGYYDTAFEAKDFIDVTAIQKAFPDRVDIK